MSNTLRLQWRRGQRTGEMDFNVSSVTSELLVEYLELKGFNSNNRPGTKKALYSAELDLSIEFEVIQKREPPLSKCDQIFNALLSAVRQSK